MNPNQYTQEWWLARRGKITGSRADRIVNGTARGWQTLAKELCVEALLPNMPSEENQAPGARSHGHEYEEIAIADASIRLGFEYERPGFKCHPTLEYVGVSTDFRIPRWREFKKPINGEAKCPFNPEIHRQTWMMRQLPNRYKAQVQLEMECWGDDHSLFISYCPAYIDHKSRGAELIVLRDQDYIDHMLERIDTFWRTLMNPMEPTCQPTQLPQLF